MFNSSGTAVRGRRRHRPPPHISAFIYLFDLHLFVGLPFLNAPRTRARQIGQIFFPRSSHHSTDDTSTQRFLRRSTAFATVICVCIIPIHSRYYVVKRVKSIEFLTSFPIIDQKANTSRAGRGGFEFDCRWPSYFVLFWWTAVARWSCHDIVRHSESVDSTGTWLFGHSGFGGRPDRCCHSASEG